MLYAPAVPKFDTALWLIQLVRVCLIWVSDNFVGGFVLMIAYGMVFPIPTLYSDNPCEYELSVSMFRTAVSILLIHAELLEVVK